MADIIDIDVFQTVTSVSFEVEPNTDIININKVTTSGYSGVPNLQEVTDEGANTTNGINIDTEDTYEIGLYAISSAVGVKGESRETYGVYGNSSSATGVYGSSDDGYGVQGYSESGVAVYGNSQDQIGVQGNSVLGTAVSAYSDYGTGLFSASTEGVGVSAYSTTNIGLEVNGNGTIAIEANLGNSNKGVVINSGASSTGNPIEIVKETTTKLVVNQQGELTATKLIKQGGTSAQLLAANGDSITAGANITISGGQISSTGGGGGGATNLSPSQTATNFTINSDTGTDATIPLGNGTLAGATLNDYTTTEKNKLAGIAVGAEVNVNADWNATSGDAQILNKPTITNLVPYTGATTDVNLGLNDITAEKLIKSGGTASQILAANGDTITAGTNITISGGTISSTGGAGGSSSVNFYLNGSIASNVAGYQQIGATSVIGTGTDFSLVGNGTIAQFLTDVGSPNRLEIPSGAWNFELWLQSSINNSGTNIHIELYKYDGAFTLIATGVSNPISLQTNTTTNLYVTNVAIPQTTLLATDRLAIRVIASNAVGLHSVTLHTEDSNLCEVITNFVGGVTAINGITQPSQTLATGTTGTDFAINSSGSTHTFNLPSASATNRGVVTTGSQTIAGNKTFTGAIGASNLSNTNTGDNATNTQYSGLATSKQDTLQSTVNIKSINGNSILGSGDLTISGTGISSLNGLTGATQTFSINSLGSGTPSWTSSGTNHQLNIPIAGGATTTGLITGTSQPISGSKQFLSNPEIPVPAGNTTSCIVLGAAGGGGSTGTLQIGSTTLYPTALEMQYVKGITSSVQTQLDGKASIIDVAEQTYSLSPTFTGTAPTTIVANTYKWNQVGSLVTVRVNLIYSTAGSITQVVIPLPADMPTPLSPTGLTGALDILYYGTGNFNTTTTTVSGASRNCFLRRNATTGYEFVIAHTAAISSRAISLTLQYFT